MSEYVMVPRVPTEAMWEATLETKHYVAFDRFQRDYKAMLAAAAPHEPAPDERVQYGEWGPIPDAGTEADAPFVPFYQLLQSPDVWVDIDQETFIEMKGFNCRVLYGVKP